MGDLQVELGFDLEDVLSLGHETALSIVFTTVDNTLMLLQYVCQLPIRFNGGIRLLVAQPASYPAQLVSPSMLASFTVRYFKAFIAGEQGIRISSVVYPVTRSELGSYLAPKAIILMSGRERWWPTDEQRLAAKLLRYGHKVIFVSPDVLLSRNDRPNAKSHDNF